MKTNLSILEAQPWLKDMDPGHLQLLAQDCVSAEFRADEIIFKEGGMANRFYLIVEGKVQVETPSMEGESVPIQLMGPGELLGYSWVFPGGSWQFDARAVTLVKALCFHGNHLRALCESNHALGYELMKRVSGIILQRLQAVRQKLVEEAQRGGR